MQPIDYLVVIKALWDRIPDKERDYGVAYLAQLADGKNPVEAAKAIALAWAGESAADEILKNELGG